MHIQDKTRFVMTGRSHRAYGDDFELPDSEYADDTAVLFVARDSLNAGVPHLITHFAWFGMEVHTGNARTEKEFTIRRKYRSFRTYLEWVSHYIH